MPRNRKPTPARSRRAVAGDAPPRKRHAPPVSSAPLAEPARAALVLEPPAEPAPPTPAPARVSRPVPTLDPAADADDVRDTRPFRERVASRRGTVSLLLFRVGPETFAAELGAVEEAVEVPALHGLPEMKTGMLGMFDLRGKLLPVFSARAVLGVPVTPGSTAAIVVRGHGRRVAVAVDDVEDVIDADCALLRNPPGKADADGVFLAILQRGTALASVVDAAALVDACVAASPEAA